MLFRCLDADGAALCGVCVAVRGADGLDFVIVSCVLLCTGVGVIGLRGAFPVFEVLAVCRAVDVVLICTGDCIPSEFRLAAGGRDAHRGLCKRCHQALCAAVCGSDIVAVDDRNSFDTVVILRARCCSLVGVGRLCGAVPVLEVHAVS